jgi:hypothetical protein
MLTGPCLCGAVIIEIGGELEHLPEACHCRQCGKHAGHFIAGVNVRRSALTVRGEESVGWYSSAEKVRRWGGTQCGFTLFWNPTPDGYEWTEVVMGLFDQLTGLRLAKHTFVGDKGDYYEIADTVPQHDRS